MWGEVLGLALLAGLLIWLLRGRNAAVVSRETRTDLTYEEREAAEELQQAEEEVKKRDTSSQPDDEEPGDDWGPGTPRSY